MIERIDLALPISQQCRLLALPRSSVYRTPAAVSAEELAIMALARPYYGWRRMAAWLATQGHRVNRKRVQRLMRLLGLGAIYQRPNTSKPAEAHKIYPYLVLCFRNNRPMVSGCTVDFITPGVDDRLAVDVVDEGHQAVLEFVFGADADMAQ
jgi:putative transposase